MNIQHNMSAASASRHLKLNEKGFRVSTQRLSTGYRINSAADDAAGLSISEKLRWQVRGMSRASENIGDGIALTQVADGALQEVHDLLQRMVELTVQAANDTNTDAFINNPAFPRTNPRIILPVYVKIHRIIIQLWRGCRLKQLNRIKLGIVTNPVNL